jgi:hypothetical protein
MVQKDKLVKARAELELQARATGMKTANFRLDTAHSTARMMFGNYTVRFVAVDGSESLSHEDVHLDLCSLEQVSL